MIERKSLSTANQPIGRMRRFMILLQGGKEMDAMVSYTRALEGDKEGLSLEGLTADFFHMDSTEASRALQNVNAEHARIVGVSEGKVISLVANLPDGETISTMQKNGKKETAGMNDASITEWIKQTYKLNEADAETALEVINVEVKAGDRKRIITASMGEGEGVEQLRDDVIEMAEVNDMLLHFLPTTFNFRTFDKREDKVGFLNSEVLFSASGYSQPLNDEVAISTMNYDLTQEKGPEGTLHFIGQETQHIFGRCE